MKKRVSDFAITMDEFHPRPSTAAAFADRKANDATIDHLNTDIKRVDVQLEAGAGDRTQLLRSERTRLQELLALTRADRERTEEHIKEAKVK